MVAADGLQGFEVRENGGERVEFRIAKIGEQLEPGERRQIGWVRLENEAEVVVGLTDR